MAVVLEYQAWAAGTYNWLDKTTATSAPLQINDKLVAWIAAVNANPSNASKQITIEKGVTAGTNSTNVGWTLKLASPSSGSTFYIGLFSSNNNEIYYLASQSWSSGTANGGYGTFSGNQSAFPGTFTTGGSNSAEFIVATETADTEEFFCLGFKSSSASSQTGSGSFLIFKDTTGEWATHYVLAGNVYGSYYLTTHTTPQRSFGLTNCAQFAQGSALDPVVLRSSTSASNLFWPAAGNSVTIASVAKSPYLFANESFGYQFAKYGSLTGGRTAVCVGYSPIFVSYV